jgi:hypothetical protein
MKNGVGKPYAKSQKQASEISSFSLIALCPKLAKTCRFGIVCGVLVPLIIGTGTLPRKAGLHCASFLVCTAILNTAQKLCGAL